MCMLFLMWSALAPCHIRFNIGPTGVSQAWGCVSNGVRIFRSKHGSAWSAQARLRARSGYARLRRDVFPRGGLPTPSLALTCGDHRECQRVHIGSASGYTSGVPAGTHRVTAVRGNAAHLRPLRRITPHCSTSAAMAYACRVRL
jgi:hypothetical protein